MVKLLLERGNVDPNREDTVYCPAPLSWASYKGCEGVARLLLGREDVNPDRPDNFDRTPLSGLLGRGVKEQWSCYWNGTMPTNKLDHCDTAGT